jgi:hypothetical protein
MRGIKIMICAARYMAGKFVKEKAADDVETVASLNPCSAANTTKPEPQNPDKNLSDGWR